MESNTSVYFNEIESEIIKRILAVQKSISLSLYSFTNARIMYAIQQLAQQGIQIEILLDKSQNNQFMKIGF